MMPVIRGLAKALISGLILALSGKHDLSGSGYKTQMQ
jgi:hypothetical protein